MSEPFLGELRLVPYNFAPRGWAACNGQVLSIAQNTALFSLLGTTYGGNGTTTFNLPDLRSRVPIHYGQGNGLSPYVLGQMGGEEAVTLNESEMPQHNHLVAGEQPNRRHHEPERGRARTCPKVLRYAVSPDHGNTFMNEALVTPAGRLASRTTTCRRTSSCSGSSRWRGSSPRGTERARGPRGRSSALRPVEAADEPFLRALYVTTRPDVAAMLGLAGRRAGVLPRRSVPGAARLLPGTVPGIGPRSSSAPVASRSAGCGSSGRRPGS